MGKAFDIGTTIHQNKSEVAISFLKELAGLFEKHQVNCILTNIQRGAWGSEEHYVSICFNDCSVPDIAIVSGVSTEELKSQLEELT